MSSTADPTEGAPPATWSIKTGNPDDHGSSEQFVMAWAKDAATGEPKYIFELDASHRGANSGCVCYSCGLPLVAINAAKHEWQKRPHFRHPHGAERDACAVLTARAAALQMLLRTDSIVLPARRMGATVVGVSGKRYSAWATKGPERVNIRSFKTQDLVTAFLTLEDGQEIIVHLTGSLEDVSSEAVKPVIQLHVDSPDLARLSPNELKARLHLLVERGRWCGAPHWDEPQLKEQAQSDAQAMATEALDWMPEQALNELKGEPSAESVLHWLAKEILRQQESIHVPAIVFKQPQAGFATLGASDAPELARKAPVRLQVSDVRLEQSMGSIRPDVAARYHDPSDGTTGLLLVEITVTNRISRERIARIKETGHATLEVDLSTLGGSLTRTEFAQLLTEELTAKRWLHHPWLDEQRVAHEAQLQAKALADQRVLAALRLNYLEAVEEHGRWIERESSAQNDREKLRRAREAALQLGSQLVSLGFEGADSLELLAGHGSVVTRLLSIRDNRVVGYRLQTLWQVLNTVLCEKAQFALKWHPLYMVALDAYKPPLKAEHQRKVNAWRKGVRESLELGESTYQRTGQLDPLLTLLFPEMEDGLTLGRH